MHIITTRIISVLYYHYNYNYICRKVRRKHFEIHSPMMRVPQCFIYRSISISRRTAYKLVAIFRGNRSNCKCHGTTLDMYKSHFADTPTRLIFDKTRLYSNETRVGD